jgi:8-oxo-dGTP pyrophosphatase MutT (NUDIX family)
VITPGEVVAILSAFDPGDDGEARKSLDLTRALLEWSPDPFVRSVFEPGHITCSGVVLNPAGDAMLLIHHLRFARWLLPGGHVEPSDAAISDAARREVVEETSADLGPDTPVLVGCDVHAIPPRSPEPMHLHHDLIFAFRARSERAMCSPESREVRWRRLSDMGDLPGSIRRGAQRAAALRHT